MSPPRVLFVSKPVEPPWRDGSKNLVRDVATALARARPTVLTSPHAPALGGAVRQEPIYGSAGSFSPSLVTNARVLKRLVTGDAMDVWHFVFAPNPASSAAARVAIAARRALGWRGRVVQTVASTPRSMRGVTALLFGDRVVALSEWMRGRLLAAGAQQDALRIIPPCAADPPRPSADDAARVRQRYALGTRPVVLYPGDYEVSTGARTVARAIPYVRKEVESALFVFACRAKTPRAEDARRALDAELVGHEDAVRHAGETDDLFTLLGTASVVAFPVDDLYGKVDVPLVVLEAMALGTPLVLVHDGPLEEVKAARHTPPRDPPALAREIVALLQHEGRRRSLAADARREYEARFTPRVVAAQYDDLYDELSL